MPLDVPPATPSLGRRPDIDRAFAHLDAAAQSADLTGIDDPQAQFVTSIRKFMTVYGSVGEMPSLEGVRSRFVDAGGVPAVWVGAARADPDRRIVFLHGGGWCSGTPEDYRYIAAVLAELSGACLLLVDYRLSPEHPFPAGLEDCIKAVAWAGDNGPLGAGRASFLGLAGDSAGGNLAAATTLATVQRGGRLPDRLVLIAATLDNMPSSDRVGTDDPVCTPEGFTNCNAAYIAEGQALDTPLISPVYADTADLARFPPTLLQVSGSEAMLYDSLRFAERLRKARVRADLSVWPDLPHVWHFFLGLLPEARAALADVAAFLRPQGPEF